MGIAPQPRGHRGTADQPYSALNLRLAFAVVGLVMSLVLAVLLWHFAGPVAGAGMLVLAVIAVVDIVVIQLRRRARRRADAEHHSLFE